METARSRFVTGGIAALATINVIPRPARAAQFEYKAGHDTPVDYPETVRARAMWDAVRRETGGRLDVKVFPASQLGSDPAMLEQVRSGAIQFYMTSGTVLGAVVPVAGMTGVPFAFRSPREAWDTFAGPLGAYVRKEVEAKTETIVLPDQWELGFRQITSSTRPVRTVADLQGFKIRIPAVPIGVRFFKTLGASPTVINISETYVALQTHIVDGQENPFAIIETWRFYEVQKYLNLTSHSWDGKWYLANRAAFAALPADIQAIVRRNSAKYAALERADLQRLNNSLPAKLSSQRMEIVHTDVSTFKARLKPYYAGLKSEFGATAWTLLEDKVGRLT